MQTATRSPTLAGSVNPATSPDKADVRVEVHAVHENQEDAASEVRDQRTPDGSVKTPLSSRFADGVLQSPRNYFTVTSPQESPRADGTASSPGPYGHGHGGIDQDVDTEDEGEHWHGFYGSTLTSAEGRNRIYGLPEGMVPSPEGSTFALPYGPSRTNSVESFVTYHSDYQAEYDSDQSMLDATGE